MNERTPFSRQDESGSAARGHRSLDVPRSVADHPRVGATKSMLLLGAENQTRCRLAAPAIVGVTMHAHVPSMDVATCILDPLPDPGMDAVELLDTQISARYAGLVRDNKDSVALPIDLCNGFGHSGNHFDLPKRADRPWTIDIEHTIPIQEDVSPFLARHVFSVSNGNRRFQTSETSMRVMLS